MLKNIFIFYQASFLNREDNCTDPSPSVRVPCFKIVYKLNLKDIITPPSSKLALGVRA
jgi:hypothetical protein